MHSGSEVIADSWWEDFFPYRAVEHGRRYAREGRTTNLSVHDQESGRCRVVSGSVRESNSIRYDIVVWIRRDARDYLSVESECGCPVEAECKHAAAVLFEALDQHPNLFDIARAISTAASPPSPVLPENLRWWLDQVQKAAGAQTTDPDAYPSNEPQRLLYMLDTPSGNAFPSVAVQAVLARQLKAGGFNRPRSYQLLTLANTSQPARFVRPVDLRIARRIFLLQGNGYIERYNLSGTAGAEALREIIATGRCYWREYEKDMSPFSLGDPRPGRLLWTTDAEGRQHPTLVVEPAATHILPVAPPWYVDMKSATCGPVETGLAPAAAEAWLKAPPVSPEHVALFTKELAQRPEVAPFPVPQAITVEEAGAMAPVAHLRLYAVPLKPYEMYYFQQGGKKPTMTDLNLAHLEFEYEGRRIQSSEPQAELACYKDGKQRRVRRDLKAERVLLGRLSQFGFKPAQQFFMYYGPHATQLTLRDEAAWMKFIQHLLPKLRAEGWRVQSDPTFRFDLAKAEDWFTDVQPGSGLDWFGVGVGVQVDGKKINLLPILVELIQSRPDLLDADKLARMRAKETIMVRLPDGRMLPFPAPRLKAILGVLVELLLPNAVRDDGLLEMPKMHAVELAALTEDHFRWLGASELRDLGRKLRGFRGIQPVAPPARLQATLRPYQLDGLNWLQFLREYELAGVLADDMGLGKTVQALAHLLAEKESGRMTRPSLVVAPTSLMTNWRQETERFAPALKVLVLHGDERKQHFDKLSDYDLIVTSYPLVPRDQTVLLAQEFHCLILDEAQYIKNPKTLWAQVVCQLKAKHRLCMTGTPMENHLGELWSQFQFLMPGFLGDEKRFRLMFRGPIEKQKSESRRTVLARRIAPFVLRRRKEEVALELPPKTEIVQNVELEGPQRDLYESIRLAMHARVKAEIDQKGMSRAHIIILDALLKLRQVCCDPRLLKLDGGRKVEQSAKLELLMDLLPEMIAEGRRILLFSQFTSMLALIEPEIARRGIAHVKLTGETTDRATPVNQFQSGKVPLFLISLKAGGTGLNLTAADTVIHYDPWWNPAVENQATDRAHRIGQDKKVFVYKLMTVGTVEEKIGQMQARKRELVDGLLNERAKFPALTTEDLDVLFAPLQ